MISPIRTTGLSFKKLKFSRVRSLFVILPISILMAIVIFASSEAANLISVAHNSIFSSIESQNQVIELNKDGNGGANARQIIFGQTDSGYTNADIETISAINNVEKSSLITLIPIKNISTTDLFNGKKVNFSDFAGLDSSYASIYTNKSFEYKEGDAIPIIINANDLKETYEDWNGQTEIDVDLSKLRQNFTPGQQPTTNPLANYNPVKTKSISYNKDDLIGKTFTMNFGGLDAIQDYKQESTSTGFKFVQKTTDEISSETATRQSDISNYWDYTKISTPISYKFVIVGIAEGADKTKTYVPMQFAQKVLANYISNERSARNSTAIATSDLNSKYQGLVYDGLTLQDDAVGSLFSGIKRQIGQQQDSINSTRSNGSFRVAPAEPISISVNFPDSSSNYYIPGLVINKDRTTSNITGENTDLNLTAEFPLESKTILIKIKSVDSRDQVITDLNSKNYTFQDFSKIKEFKKLESYLSTAVNIGSIAFMIITAVFVLINMSRFVSEARKEIGIFRAMGATRSDIRKLFISQSLVYIIFAILVGIVIGAIAVFGLSSVIVGYAQTFINSTVGGIITLTGGVSQSNFMNIEVKTLAIYTFVLLIVTLVVSLWPAEQASRVSPVEAIRN